MTLLKFVVGERPTRRSSSPWNHLKVSRSCLKHRHHIDLLVTNEQNGPNLTEMREFGGQVFYAPWYAESVPRRASDNLDRTKEWLQACISNHDSCRQWCSSLRSSNKRPARVVELTAHGVRLQCDVEGIVEFEYITLSHIWGPDPAKQLKLMTSRLGEFQVTIPTDELPAIFTEAIRITRHLGFKYIWIDSLCKAIFWVRSGCSYFNASDCSVNSAPD
jgi:hypothetical protein